MQLDISLLLASIGVLSSVAASPAPAAQDDTNKPRPCNVPQKFFTSLEKPFSLAALVPGPSTSTQQSSWPVQLSPRDPSKKVTSKPVISQTKILPPKFKLVNQTLATEDGGFPADLSPVIAIFPPPPQPFTFGGPYAGSSPGKFGAVYACDNTGTRILKLVPDQARGFAVNKIAEGQQVFIRPEQNKDKLTDVTLRINGG